jgi:tRNA G18 (ribose-2'-O)-methylase SpoU
MVCRAHAARPPTRVIRITSLGDPRIESYRHLADPQWLQGAGLFVAEGRLVVRRLLSNPRFATSSVLVTEPAHGALADALEGSPAPVFIVDQHVMNQIAGFNIHRGCLALAKRPAALTLAALPLGSLHRIVVLEGVNNPDNVGGIFRSAAAFGVDAVILGPSCSDPLYRKSVRTSMAATLQVPFAAAGAWPQALHLLRAHGLQVLALTPSADAASLDGVPRDGERIAVLVGAEGTGLTPEALSAADRRVRISMTGRADSLNVTVAASIALHWFQRNRPSLALV